MVFGQPERGLPLDFWSLSKNTASSKEQFSKRGIFYKPSEKTKSELYRDLLPIVNSGAVDLIEHERLVMQLASLERRTARGGKDSIDHSPGMHDDIANAAAGALVTSFRDPGVPGFRQPIVFPKMYVV